jgi:hypothetical protein
MEDGVVRDSDAVGKRVAVLAFGFAHVPEFRIVHRDQATLQKFGTGRVGIRAQ